MTIDTLQIRVGRFDSGPRLHHFSLEINKTAPQGAFCCVRFGRVLLGLKGQGKDRIPVLENGINLLAQRCRAPYAYWISVFSRPRPLPTPRFRGGPIQTG